MEEKNKKKVFCTLDIRRLIGRKDCPEIAQNLKSVAFRYKLYLQIKLNANAVS